MDFDPLLGVDEDYLLERECRLSKSVLWRLQREFYRDQSTAFSSGMVPFYATTNAFIANAYAQLIEGFIEDTMDPDPDAGPVTILELGAGHGRFGFLCLSMLFERYHKPGQKPPIRYVLSDLFEHSLTAWLAHPRLAALFEAGWLDIARFDAEKDQVLSLRLSGKTFRPGRPCGPLVAIANYFFDGLIHDVFRIQDGALQEGRITLMADHPLPNAGSPGLLGRLAALFTYTALDRTAFYAAPELNRILEYYRLNLGDRAFSFPLGAVRCIDSLDALCAGPLLVISSDKAHNSLQRLQDHAPTVASHGSISMMVNHHALGRYVVNQGGRAMLSSDRSGELETAAFYLGAPSERIARVFDRTIEQFSPSDFLTLFKESAPTSMGANLKLLRLASWDPHWLRQLLPMLRTNLSDTDAPMRQELLAGLLRADAQTFPIGDDDYHIAIEQLRCAILAMEG